MMFHLVQKEDAKPVINTGTQVIYNSQKIISIVIISCIMGLLFGLIFGIMDIEDVSVYHIKQELLKEENYCIPIGLLLGAIAGFIGLVTENVFLLLFRKV